MILSKFNLKQNNLFKVFKSEALNEFCHEKNLSKMTVFYPKKQNISGQNQNTVKAERMVENFAARLFQGIDEHIKFSRGRIA